MPSRTKPGTRYTGLLGSSFNPTDNKGRSSPTMTNRTGLAISSFFSQKDFVLNELSRRFCFDDKDPGNFQIFTDNFDIFENRTSTFVFLSKCI